MPDSHFLTGALSEIRSKNWEILYADESTESEKYDAAIKIFETYYSRSLNANGHDPAHPKFDDYCAMLLHQERFKRDLVPETYAALVEGYGTKPGLPNDETTWRIDELIATGKYGEGLYKKARKKKGGV